MHVIHLQIGTLEAVTIILVLLKKGVKDNEFWKVENWNKTQQNPVVKSKIGT